ncbi:MAG: hypothetical protein Q8Q12_03025 [bacterium]|nr:hypothetical protein [bacterium]
MPTELKHCSGQACEIVLIESPAWPRFEVQLWRPDGVFLVAGTDDEKTAETIYLQASIAF